ncbi:MULTISPECIES: type II secretion system F family protein [unclassified Actinomyces]|uniref:type II secretion system F family protein n=1 Tax=unclassified Actinomyces TaxID=2609248 RepID=UPI002016F028|nr:MULTISPECIES: type II secretion system F family protein [unclassified Actinomyces]MCL3778031.1 type II secretion system F family protein [Actinomyces sp. AC-20-1]MCL3789994.1 type II secretion system F family protein [Actinomyces sp. 187325]MCL3791528.1 type II secretion system F family protein [Actinomyces sp. 186855]MCL3793819.1 type II secretion system F family protein [Actinomyces sp. 217892]
MGALAGLLGGLGAVLVWLARTTEPPQWRSERSRRLADLLVQAGAGGTSPTVFVAGSAGTGVVVGLLFLGVSRAWPIALAFGAIAAGLPFLVLSSRARARRTRLREVWPEAVDALVSGVRAGMSLPEAVAALGERGPEAVREQFRAFASDYAATARFGQCLDRLKDRFADPVADRIVEALRLAHEVGGTDLGVLLRSLSHMLREDMRTRGELEARQSWTVNGAKVAVAAPWLVLALLSTRPQAAQAYASAAGALVLAAGAVASVVAYRLMLMLGRLPEEGRVLR